MSIKPPPSPSGARETCPLCGVQFDPAAGHLCEDQQSGRLSLAEVDVEDERTSAAVAARASDPFADRYEMLGELSRGGMGVVYKARRRILGDTVAVKVLLNPGSETDQRRFLQEAQLASKVNHPNTVSIYDFGVLPTGKSFLVMEFLEGPTLASLMRKQEKHQLDMVRACKIAAQIAHGMQTVHDRGVVHRDLKPENIFVLEQVKGQTNSEDFVKIVDFGIAKDQAGGAAAGMSAELQAALARKQLTKAAGGQGAPSIADEWTNPTQSERRSSDSNKSAAGLTQVGASLGTPRYMAPEQVDGKGVGSHSDQYALGCILYQMISGKTPFGGDSSMAILASHLVEKPVTLRQRAPELKVPESLDAVVLKMLSKRPSDRYGSMREAAAALEHEIEVLSLQRGDKVVLSSGLAALLGGRKGTHVIIRGRKIPLVGVIGAALSLLIVLAVGGVLTYRHYFVESTSLEPGELRALEERARQILMDDLRADSPELRLGAVNGLAQTRDARYRTSLSEKLADVSPIMQAQAADALGLLGDRQAVPELLAAMKRSQSGPVQLASAQALLALGDEQGQQLLQSELKSSSEQTRLRAASLLCERGEPQALEIIRKIIQQKRVSEELTLNLLTCLSHAGDENARQALREQLHTASTPSGSMVAAAKLAQLGLEDGRAFLRERIRKQDAEQLLAARFLAAPDEPQVAALFRQVLRDRAAAVSPRMLAIEGLGLSGQLIDARLLGRQLDKVSEPSVQLSAATSIVLLARSAPAALSDDSLRWARGALADSKWAIREAAVGVIGDSNAPDAVPLLTKLLKDSHPMVRQSAARALGRRREGAAAVALREGLRDGDTAVRQESLRSLLRLSKAAGTDANKQVGANAAAWVKETLDTGSDAEKALAGSLLLKLGDRKQLEGLRTLAASASPEVRQLVVENLGQEQDVLLSMLKDSVFAVRFGAATQLAQANDQRAVPVLREALARKSAESLMALSLLRKLGEKVELPAGLVDVVISGPVSQRLAAAEIAARLPPELALALLRPLAHDADTQVRRVVAAAAAELPAGPDGAPGVPVLRLLAADSDPSVRARAAALLVQLLPPEKEVVQATQKDDKGEQDKKGGHSGQGGSESATPATPVETPPDMAEPPADLAEPQSDQPEARGFLVVEAPPLVQFQIDHSHWQTAGKQPLHLTVGSHQVVSLSGPQKVEVTENETVTVQVPESAVEKLVSSGLEAAERKDYRKAGKLLDKASGICSREHKYPQPCNDLAIEAFYQLGVINQAQDKFSEAMNDYQQVVQLSGSSKGKQERRSAAQRAMNELLPSLGQVVIPKKVKKKCQEVTLYMLPGTHQIDIDGESQTVKVRAQETVRLGSCQ